MSTIFTAKYIRKQREFWEREVQKEREKEAAEAAEAAKQKPKRIKKPKTK